MTTLERMPEEKQPPGFSRRSKEGYRLLTRALLLDPGAYLAKTLMVVIISWSTAIVIRAILIAHEFSLWRSLATVVIALFTHFVIVPLTLGLTTAYVLFG